MATTLFTDALAGKAKVPESGWRIERDSKVRGLGLRVTHTGSRSWVLDYMVRGRRRIYTIGAYPGWKVGPARVKAQELQRRIRHEGYDPAAELKERREAVTMEDVINDYMADQLPKLKASTVTDQTYLINGHILPAVGRIALVDLTLKDVVKMHTAITKAGKPRRANYAVATLRKILNGAIRAGDIQINPAAMVEKNPQKDRDRALDSKELKAVWLAAETEGYPFGDIVRLLILTAQRRNEIAGLAWSEIDLEKAIIKLPADRVKNGHAHTVPLSDQAVAILKGITRTDSDLVFTTTGTTMVSGFSKAKGRIETAASIPHWTVHDLRRSAVTGMASIGIAQHVTEKVINHKSESFAGVAGIYNRHSFQSEMRDALVAWGNHVERVIVKSNVIPMQKRGTQ